VNQKIHPAKEILTAAIPIQATQMNPTRVIPTLQMEMPVVQSVAGVVVVRARPMTLISMTPTRLSEFGSLAAKIKNLRDPLG
jgi:hypothetical protein